GVSSAQPLPQTGTHLRPFLAQDAEVVDIGHRAVSGGPEAPQRAFVACSQPRYGPVGAGVATVAAKRDPAECQLAEGVLQHQQLHRRVQRPAPLGTGIEGVADLDAQTGNQVVEGGEADGATIAASSLGNGALMPAQISSSTSSRSTAASWSGSSRRTQISPSLRVRVCCIWDAPRRSGRGSGGGDDLDPLELLEVQVAGGG